MRTARGRDATPRGNRFATMPHPDIPTTPASFGMTAGVRSGSQAGVVYPGGAGSDRDPARIFLLRESAVCHPERSCGEWGVGVRDRREAILSVSCEILATYYVYIMTNRTRRLYVGVTNDLGRRVYQHKHHVMPGFTSKYFLERLVYFEETNDVRAAISREKELKGWRRSKKIALIEKLNPRWSDLSCGWSE